METTLTIVINAIVAILGSSLGYFFGYKKNKKEAESIGIQNVEKALDIYKQMLDDMKKRYDLEIENLKAKLSEYQQHIATLETKIKELKKPKP
jgi:CII-binding regulator of phage lambda lysogenization HflD